ncbi:MAG: dipeptide epimerase [Candidatus Azobacteroides sp.]|nr:dipeptide epimerase [Candidatus Azobacteroides sp.]
MKLTYYSYNLELKTVFNLSQSSRKFTPTILTEINYENFTGYGEASLPPYLKETPESVSLFLEKVNFSSFSSNFNLEEILEYIHHLIPENYAAKASLDIALHDLFGKIKEKPCYEIWDLKPDMAPSTSFTIGIDKPHRVIEKAKEAANYDLIKVKLGSEEDKTIIETIRSVTDKPICADINQGWSDKFYALDMLHWCKEQNIVFVEQPLPKEKAEDMAWLTSHSPIPTFADESFQHLDDLKKIKNSFSGINIKLMKCGGLSEARKIIEEARKEGLLIMLGCMVETSCAISAASQIASLVDYIDLDGNLLISNDCFTGAKVKNGKVIPTDAPGIGVLKNT